MKYPKRTGNFRGSKLTLLIVFGTIVCSVGLGFGYRQAQHQDIQPTNVDNSGSTGTPIAIEKSPSQWQVSDIDVTDLWNQTNAARAQAGLAALSLNPALNTSAAAKCADMVAKNYWAHNDPSGQEPWHFIKEAGVQYRFAGENLGAGYDTSPALFAGWMNSQEHKDNILSSHFTDVGFAVCKTGDSFPTNTAPTLLVIQHFSG